MWLSCKCNKPTYNKILSYYYKLQVCTISLYNTTFPSTTTFVSYSSFFPFSVITTTAGIELLRYRQVRIRAIENGHR